MRAALYIRVSTDEQSASADAQEVGAREWCLRNGHTVAQVYRDDGVSGAEWLRRPGVVAIQFDVRATPRPWDVLVVRDLDRLGRDALRLGLLLEALNDHGAKLVEWSTGVEAQLGPMERGMLFLRGIFAEQERSQGAHRTRVSLEQRAKRGLVTGGVVYGYTNVRETDGVHYVVHEGQAALVREIYARHIDGESARAIAVRLNARGVPSPRAEGGGSGSWCTSKVHAILRSERYKGIATWGRIGAKYRGGSRVTERRDEVVRYEVPAIVDAETWQRAQASADRVRATNDAPPRRGGRARYLLVGHAVCDACGGPIGSGRTSHGNGPDRALLPTYCCLWRRDRGLCDRTWNRSTAAIDAAVIDWLVRDVFDPAMIAAAAKRARERIETPGPDPLVEKLQTEERELATAVSRLTLALETAPDVPELAARLRDRSERLRSVRADLGRAMTPSAAVPAGHEAMMVSSAEEVRAALLAAREERPDLVRAVLASCLTGRIRVGCAGPRQPLTLVGKATPRLPFSISLAAGEKENRGVCSRPQWELNPCYRRERPMS